MILRTSLSRPRVASALLALGLSLSACSPALNWREVRVDPPSGLLAQFPCKPDRHVRQVAWPGVPGGLEMTMLSCQVDDSTWAVSHMRLPDVRQVEGALSGLRAQMQANLEAAARMATPPRPVVATALGAAAVPGMTPSAQAQAWQFRATRPDGLGRPMPMRVRAWHFSHGLTVFQASVSHPDAASGGQSSEDMADVFLSSFHFPG